MFKLVSKFEPAGDQPQAIEKLVKGIENGEKHQVLLGATGTGKTYVYTKMIDHTLSGDYVNDTVSREIVLWLFFVVWATDIGGYVVGKTVGGPKIAPKIRCIAYLSPALYPASLSNFV